MSTALQNLFAEKLDYDTREPVFFFDLWDESYGLLAPSISFWVQISALLLIQSIICILLAAIVYRFIIQKRGSTLAFLTGYGIVIPFVVLMPFHIIRAFDIRNMCFMVSVSSTPILIVFRCLEAMYGFSPPAVEASMQNYCVYYSSVIEFVFDAKTAKPARTTRNEIRQKGVWFILNYLLLGALYSLIEPHNYKPFDARVGSGEDDMITDFFSIGHLLNNLLVAVLSQLCLATGTLGFGFAISAFAGISTINVMSNPMFGSKSPSDFWGRRWNRLVHGVLKRGVFKPMRRVVPKAVAAAATFVASGLMHEYVLMVISNKHWDEECSNCYSPAHGMHLAFFGWNGMVVMLEYLAYDMLVFQWMRGALPAPIITASVLMTVLPISHWFTHEYINSGFYSDFKVGFPQIVKI